MAGNSPSIRAASTAGESQSAAAKSMMPSSRSPRKRKCSTRRSRTHGWQRTARVAHGSKQSRAARIRRCRTMRSGSGSGSRRSTHLLNTSNRLLTALHGPTRVPNDVRQIWCKRPTASHASASFASFQFTVDADSPGIQSRSSQTRLATAIIVRPFTVGTGQGTKFKPARTASICQVWIVRSFSPPTDSTWAFARISGRRDVAPHHSNAPLNPSFEIGAQSNDLTGPA